MTYILDRGLIKLVVAASESLRGETLIAAQEEVFVKLPTRQLVHAFIFLLGIVLMVGGIATGKHGASIVGLIVAAVNFQQWQKWNKQRAIGDKERNA